MEIKEGKKEQEEKPVVFSAEIGMELLTVIQSKEK